MLIGKSHRIIKGLTPLCEAIKTAMKASSDSVRQPGTFQALEVRDALIDVSLEMDKVLMHIQTRKQNRRKV